MTRPKVPINPSVLEWALDESGRDATDLASAIGVDERVFRDWLAGRERPSVTQFRKLAAALKRPSAVLLLPEPPKGSVPRVEFRQAPDRHDRQLNPQERVCLREAGRLQRGLRWVLEELDENGVRLPKASASGDPDTVARRVRELTGISVGAQLAWKNEFAAFREWRAAVEALGAVVLALPVGAESSRGFSIWDDRAPLIAINTHWNPSARIFTLFHEVGHLLSRTSSVCDEDLARGQNDIADPVERWCESFAAAFLLPWPAVETFLRTKTGWDGRKQITGLGPPSRMARAFKVSLRASVLRLINRGFAGWNLYRSIPRSSETKRGGGGSGRTRSEARLDQYGRRAARVFLHGLQRDVLSRDDVLSYLNIGDRELRHVEEDVAAE